MRRKLEIVMVLVAASLVGVRAESGERSRFRFQPRATSVVGADTAATRAPFTRVWTQAAGELAMERAFGRYVNLSLDFPMMLRKYAAEDEPVVAYTTVTWADQLLRIVCHIDKSRSSVPKLRFRVVLSVTEGSIGTTPPGTTFGETDFRIFFEDGNLVMTTDFVFTPGILPEVLPTDFVMSEIIFPDSWLTFRPGEVVAEHTFTSIMPPDGSEPRVFQVTERFPIAKRNGGTP